MVRANWHWLNTSLNLPHHSASTRSVFLNAGQLGTSSTWFNASAFAGLKPSDGNVSLLLAARSGELPTLPQAVVAMFSPCIQFQLTPTAYADLKSQWQVGGLALHLLAPMDQRCSLCLLRRNTHTVSTVDACRVSAPVAPGRLL